MLKKVLKIMFFMLISLNAFGVTHYLQMGIGTDTQYTNHNNKIEYSNRLYNNDILIPADGKITKISLITSYTKNCLFANEETCFFNHEQSPTKQDTQVQFDIIRDGIEMPLSNGKFIFPVGSKELDNQEHELLESSNIVKKGDILKIHAKISYYNHYTSWINLNSIIQLETDN